MTVYGWLSWLSLLAGNKINIVSGFAAGVDMNAHRAALAAGGTTTVVLAEGILRFRVKKEIRDLWDENRTLVVSEFGKLSGSQATGRQLQFGLKLIF